MAPSLSARVVALLAIVGFLSGCATARDPRDPWEPVNRVTFEVNETLDKTLFKPVAMGYNYVLPTPIRTWVSNFFSNLNDVVVLANDLLQFKLLRARDDSTRLFINSTVGLFGINDVASDLGLIKHEEDFGQTLGVWGLGPGPYFVIPIIGASTVRDTVGYAGDIFFAPLLYVEDVSARNELIGLRFLSLRAQLIDAERVIEEAAIDKYAFIRDAYLQRRLNLIYDGNPPGQLEEDNGGTAPDAPPAAKPSDAAGAPAPSLPPARASAAKAALNVFEPREPAVACVAGPDSRDPVAPKTVRLWLPDTSR
jgi:phospholipid-binding lipoprotein MlaA